jgi:probable O-glycosylation ligase (exosortase A-associated)
MPLRGLILTAIFVASLPVCFLRPFYGIWLWTIVSFLNPQEYTWSAATAIPWAVLVAVPTLAGMFIFHTQEWGRLRSRETFLIVVLWIWFTFTSLISTHTPLFMHHATDTWFRWNEVSKILLMSLAMVIIVNDFRKLRVLLLTIAGSFGVFVAKTFPFIIASGGQFRVYGPPNSMIADNNDFGLALDMTLPLFFFLAQSETKPWVKRLFGFLFLITIPAILFTYSRGALLGLLILSALMIVRLKQRLPVIAVVVIGLLVGLMFAPEAWRHRMDPTRDDAIDASAKSRIVAWTFAYNLASDYPVTGGGFGTFTQELFSRYGPVVDVHAAHSIYFQVLGEHGYTGLLLYLTLAAVCLIASSRLLSQASARNDVTVGLYANMLRFSIVGFLIPGFFLARAYFDYYFAIVACLAILRRVAAERWAEEDAEAEQAVEEESGGCEPFAAETALGT